MKHLTFSYFNPLDPTDLPSNMQDFPRISPKFRANILIQRPTYVYLLMITISFLLHLREHLSSFNLICWTHICGKYFLNVSILEKCGKIWENGVFPGGYGRIGEILHGRIGVYRVNRFVFLNVQHLWKAKVAVGGH